MFFVASAEPNGKWLNASVFQPCHIPSITIPIKSLSLSLSLSLFIYIYIYMYTVFIYTHRKRCKKQDLFVWFDNGSSLKVLFFTSFTKNLRRFRPWTVIWRIIIERIPSCRWLVCEWDGEIPGVTGEAFLRWNLSLISNK